MNIEDIETHFTGMINTEKYAEFKKWLHYKLNPDPVRSYFAIWVWVKDAAGEHKQVGLSLHTSAEDMTNLLSLDTSQQKDFTTLLTYIDDRVKHLLDSVKEFLKQNPGCKIDRKFTNSRSKAGFSPFQIK